LILKVRIVNAFLKDSPKYYPTIELDYYDGMSNNMHIIIYFVETGHAPSLHPTLQVGTKKDESISRRLISLWLKKIKMIMKISSGLSAEIT